MRRAFLLTASCVLAVGLGGCILDPDSAPYDPRYPTQTGSLEPINPYKTDEIPSTAYEVWKRDTERNDRIANEGGGQNTYPPLFKGQKPSDGGT